MIDEDDAIDPPKTADAAKSPKGHCVLPKYLPRIEEIIAPDITCDYSAYTLIETAKPNGIDTQA